MYYRLIWICLLFDLFLIHYSYGQDLSDIPQSENLLEQLDSRPYLRIYKDNYFTTGLKSLGRLSSENCNVKYQISIQQRVTKSILPFQTYLFLAYTQKTMWSIYKKSCPFDNNDYNPAIGLGKYLIKDNRLIGQMSLLLEHESNGCDGENSRSWNRISFHAMFPLTKNSNLQMKGWIPFIKKKDNPDYLKYGGIGYVTYNLRTPNKKFIFSLSLIKRGELNWNFNIEAEASYKLPFILNQYVFLQLYSGYAEDMLNYKKHSQGIRLGIAFKPAFFTLY
jgi:phospholipase A1